VLQSIGNGRLTPSFNSNHQIMHEHYPSNQTEKLECALRLLLSAFDKQLDNGQRVNQTLSMEAKEAFYGPILGARIALQSIKPNE
jgi:hypothetical protein